ncbi:unnamed protein product [Prunus brigantina]
MALSTHRASTSRTSAEWALPRWKHDVFLSFRGEDTRRGFISHLDRALAFWQALGTFKDDRALEVGATISLELSTAIEESYLAIIVLSPNYASSTWCLDELSKILECMEDTKRILPIFYDVDPSDVRHQRGSFAEAFTKHEERFSGDEEKLNQWRAALTKVANLKGLDSKTYKSDAELVDDIVKRVWKKVNPTFTLLDSQEKLVGIDSALDQLSLHLAPEENDVRFIGIWGMAGVGKTALANLVFQKISHRFEVKCFLSNVRKREVCDLQRQLLSKILDQSINHVYDEREGTDFINKVLRNKKVLLVLDDVDQLHQLEVLAREKNLFGVGSRIIITTRDKRLLVQHGTTTFKVEVLKNDEALLLFSRHAFKKDQPEEGFQELSQHFLYYANGLPLALKILGRALYGREQDVWKSELHDLNKIPDPNIFDSLKVSYYGLKYMEKKIFLHVACFHRGKNKEQVIRILDGSLDISSLSKIDILVEKSLLTIEEIHSWNDTVEMHDLIQEMAWIIVHEESPNEPGKRSLLWHHSDISHVFMNNTGTGAIEGMVLALPKLEEVPWKCTEAFNEMHGLRLLDFDNAVFSSGPNFLPNSLKIIHWSWYPSKSLPSSFEPHLLSKLEMKNSKLVRLWDGAKDIPNLKYMDLSNSENLTSIPDFTRIPNLEELNLKRCKILGKVHPSIAVHKKLKVLELDECISITSLPSALEMDSLECFSLWGCSKVRKIPEFGEHMQNLLQLNLARTAIEQIPSSIEHLVGLNCLYIMECKSLLGLPSAICKLKSLISLFMYGCSKVDKLPGEMECLVELELDGSSMREPLVAMKNLETLHISESVDSRDGIWCGLDGLFGIRKSVDPVPWGLVLSSLNRLGSLRDLVLGDCNIDEGAIPDDIGCMSSLEALDLWGNNFVSLPSSIRFLSKLRCLGLQRCKRLEQVPDLPPRRYRYPSLFVGVDNCTSLKRLSDPSKLSEGANVYDFDFSCHNCFRLVEEEGWINRIFVIIMRLATEVSYSDDRVVWPGSEIPDWFDNRSVGNSIIVEPPLPPQTCSDWVGIALCVVFETSAPPNYKYLQIPF